MQIKPGDKVLVDTMPQGLPGPHWVKVLDVITSPGALYHLKVQLPNRVTIGHIRREELMDHHPKASTPPRHTPPRRGSHPI